MTGRRGVFALLVLPCALSAQPVTFSNDIAPILFRYCAPCHRPGETAPFSLLTYQDARKRGAQIVRVTQRGYMPPWPPAPGHGEFAGARRLTPRQISLLAGWVAGGMPEGDPAALPPAPKFTAGWQLGPPDLVLELPQPYRLPAEGGDVFRNFIIPVDLKQTRYIRAMELLPGEKRLVHHANLIVDRSRMLRRRDGRDGEPGFPGMDVETEVSGEFDPDSHFLFWKPGSPPEEEPAGMAWKLDPGSDLIVNLHLRPSGKPETVRVSVGLYFADRPPTKFPMLLQLEHDGAIDIPAGSRQFTVTDHLKLPVAVRLLAIYPHAHYLGKQIDAWAELPSGERQSLLRINDWDLNWQATYTYRKPVALPAGATVAMRITYDNTSRNPRNPANPPQRVRAGNRSQDEMGHVWLQVLPEGSDGDGPRLLLQESVMRRRLEKYPSDFVANFNLGAALQTTGKHPEALPFLAAAARIRPSNATAHNNLGVSLLVVERPEEALREFRDSLRLDPRYQNARFNLARALSAQGDKRGALQEYLAYLEAAPDDAQAQEYTGRLYAEMGQVAESIPHFRKAAALDPGNPAAQTNLGVALALAGDLPAAIAAFEHALQSDPSNQAARENLQRARLNLGKQP